MFKDSGTCPIMIFSESITQVCTRGKQEWRIRKWQTQYARSSHLNPGKNEKKSQDDSCAAGLESN